MKVPKLNNIKASETIACVDIAELIKVGMYIDEHEIEDDFKCSYSVDNIQIFDLHVVRSRGWYGNVEFHYGILLDDISENIHIAQEVQIHHNDRDAYFFICPLTFEVRYCTNLYLRDDYPFFGSKEALNIS